MNRQEPSRKGVAERRAPGLVTPDEWHAYHFGEAFVRAAGYDHEALYGKSAHGCYVVMADFCSFTSFLRATPHVGIIKSLLTSFYTDLRHTIHRHNGMLDKIMGDGLLAIWGLHHREKIASIFAAAREMTQVANRYAEQWQSLIDSVVDPKGMRIGIAKGEVAVIRRDHVYEGMAFLGSVINLAARLQRIAEPNQIVCSNTVYAAAQRAGLKLRFRSYKLEIGADLNAKNYGAVKAWVVDLRTRSLK